MIDAGYDMTDNIGNQSPGSLELPERLPRSAHDQNAEARPDFLASGSVRAWINPAIVESCPHEAVDLPVSPNRAALTILAELLGGGTQTTS